MSYKYFSKYAIGVFLYFFLISPLTGESYENPSSRWLKWAFNQIIVKEPDFNEPDEFSRYFSYDYFAQYEDLVIRRINIKKLNVFAEYPDSSRISFFNFINKTGNSLHINTQNFIINNHLLFNVGDKIDPFYFAESERLLRKNNFIYETAIIIIPDHHSEFADVYVYTKDVWSIRISGKYNTSKETGNIQISDINFLGSGGKLFFDIKKNPAYGNDYKVDAEYTFERLFDKFGQGSVYYYSDLDYINYGIGGNQFFVQPWLKWLGGINLDKFQTRTNLIEQDTLSYRVPIYYNQQDFWLGYTLSFSDTSVPGLYNHIILANRIVRTGYSRFPEYYKEHFKENYFYLSNFTFLRRSFFQDSYIFAFGKIEDIPVGFKIDFLAGSEIGKSLNRQYYGTGFIFADYYENLGYNLFNLRVGSYSNDKGWESGLLDFNILSFSELKHFHSLKYRNFYSVRLSKSLNVLTKDDLIQVNRNNGIRGFDYSIYGSQRAIFNFENNIFLPFSVLGFKTAFVSFADFALIANDNERLVNQTVQQGYGFSLRFKNEQLVFSTLQLSLAWYPKANQYNISDFRFFTEHHNFYQFNQMNYRKPEIFKW